MMRGFRLVRRVDCHIFSRSHTPILLFKDSAAHVTLPPPPRSRLSQSLSFPACSVGDRCRAADFGRKQQKRILWDGRADQAEFHVERVLDHVYDLLPRAEGRRSRVRAILLRGALC